MKSTLKNTAKDIFKKGAAEAEKAFTDHFIKSLNKELGDIIRKNVISPVLARVRGALSGGQKMVSGIAQLKVAYLRKELEELIVIQRINDIKDNWTQKRKKNQEKQLGDYLQQSSTAVSNAVSIMEDYGTALVKIACNRA